jgi:hypothetical protein
MKFVKGKILDAEYGVIANPVSCTISEWTGISQDIRIKYPIAFSEYQNINTRVPNRVNRLGLCQLVEVIRRNLFIANMFIVWGGFVVENENKNPIPVYMSKQFEINPIAASASGLKNWLRSIDIKDFPVYFPGNDIFSDSKIKIVIKYHLPDAIMVRQI